MDQGPRRAIDVHQAVLDDDCGQEDEAEQEQKSRLEHPAPGICPGRRL